MRSASEAPLAHVLGIDTDAGTGPGSVFAEQFGAVASKAVEVRQRLQDLDDAAAELTLLRKSTSVCRVTHLLRAAGIYLPPEALRRRDEDVASELQRVLGSALPSHSVQQATLPTCQAGLGLARAQDIAAIAFVAARTEASPMVHELFEGLAKVVGQRQELFDDFARELRKATDRVRGQLDERRRAIADETIIVATEAAEQDFAAIRSGRRPRVRSPAERAEAELVLPAGAEDAEVDEQQRLQGALARLLAEVSLERLEETFSESQEWDAIVRLRELRDPSVSHEWMNALNPAHGPVLPPDEYVDAIKLRIGALVRDEPGPCPRCGGVMDVRGAHSQCCALGAATRGHYMVCHDVHMLASLGDPQTCAEPRGLVPTRPMLRPADILTSATSRGLAALDVGICSPLATGAGFDCCDATFRRKTRVYKDILGELREQGVHYEPMVWSSFGRPHSATSQTLEQLARSGARRLGLRDWRPILARCRRRIAVSLQRRLVAQLRDCLHEDDGAALAGDHTGDEDLGRDRDPAAEEAAAAEVLDLSATCVGGVACAGCEAGQQLPATPRL